MSSYTTGTANTFADLKTAIETALVAEGWTLLNDVLSLDGCFFKLIATGTYMLAVQPGDGQSGSTITNPPTQWPAMYNPNSSFITWPVTYEIHSEVADREVFVVINYNSDFYQHLGFGKHMDRNLNCNGAWASGMQAANVTSAGTQLGRMVMTISIGGSSGTSNSSTTVNGPYGFCVSPVSWPTDFNRCGYDSNQWRVGANSGAAGQCLWGLGYNGQWAASPGRMTSAPFMIPLRGYYTTGGTSLIRKIGGKRNIRRLRNDYLLPGEIVTIGSDKWKIYPIYRRNTSVRDGVPNPGDTHSGTVAVAIRYRGP